MNNIEQSMADLTSRFRNKNLRDLSMQACVNVIDKTYEHFSQYYYTGSFTDFFDIQGGTQPPKSKFIYSPQKNYVRFLQIRDFSSDATPTYIPVDSKNKLCEDEDILLGRYGASVGKILSGKSGAYNVACAKVILLDKTIIDKEYVFYLLHSPVIQNQIRGISRSAQGGFNKGDLSKIEIVIPKFYYQKKILSILKTIDRFLIDNSALNFDVGQDTFLESLISAFNKQLNTVKEIEKISDELILQKSYLQQLRQSILQEAVQGKLTQRQPDDEPASKLLERIKAEKQQLIAAGKLKKEKPLPTITADEIPFVLPEGWVWCRLGEIVDLISGVTLGKIYKEQLLKVPYLRVANVQRGYVDTSNVKELFVPQTEITKYSLKAGDLVMIEGGDWDKVGRCAIWDGSINPCIHQNHIFRLRFYGRIYNNWAELLLNSPAVRRYFESCSKQTTNLASINKTQLNNALVPLPSINEQERIVTKVQQLVLMTNELEQQVQQSQTQAQQLLQAVLKEAFNPKEKEYTTNGGMSIAAED